jgi:aconitate hydratase
VKQEFFRKEYDTIFDGDRFWQDLDVTKSTTFTWDDQSTYIKNPPYFEAFKVETDKPGDISEANALVLLGDSVTTDHISPAGAIPKEYPAGKYLIDNKVNPEEFNSYGARRGNHEVMMRGTFGNIRIKNLMDNLREGSFTLKFPSGEEKFIYDAAMEYQKENKPLVILGGKEYGTGSSRDWAAKGTALLGVKAIIAESYERIHRSNLVGMGVLPLVFKDGESWKSLGLDGSETFSIKGIENMTPRKSLEVTARKTDGTQVRFFVTARLDTVVDVEYFENNGILPCILRKLLKMESPA